MLRHVVLFRFKAGTPEEARADLQKSLQALAGKIEEIRAFEVGRDVIRSERSYDLALVSSFDDLDALQRYQVHPEHQAVVAKVRQLCDSVVAADYAA
jgi:hypothetical protein